MCKNKQNQRVLTYRCCSGWWKGFHSICECPTTLTHLWNASTFLQMLDAISSHEKHCWQASSQQKWVMGIGKLGKEECCYLSVLHCQLNSHAETFPVSGSFLGYIFSYLLRGKSQRTDFGSQRRGCAHLSSCPQSNQRRKNLNKPDLGQLTLIQKTLICTYSVTHFFLETCTVSTHYFCITEEKPDSKNNPWRKYIEAREQREIVGRERECEARYIPVTLT
jgi:hypothetical protein